MSSKAKYRLKRKILNSKEDLILRLSADELEFLQNSNINRDIIPYEYLIKTKRVLPTLQKVNKIFREIDDASKNGKKFLFKVLLPSELKFLRYFDYFVVPVTYKVLYPYM